MYDGLFKSKIKWRYNVVSRVKEVLVDVGGVGGIRINIKIYLWIF